MVDDTTLPESLGKLEIDSQSVLEPDSQPSLESLSLLGDDCPRECCKCNTRRQERTSSAWNGRRLLHSPVSSSLKSGIIRKSRFKNVNLRVKTRILREPILKLGSEDSRNPSPCVSPVRLDSKPPIDVSSESIKSPSEHLKSQGRVFGACAAVSRNDFSSLLPSKSKSEERKELKQFTATSYRHLRTSATVSTATQSSRVIKRKKEHRKESNSKSRPVADSTNTLTTRQSTSQPSGNQSTSCSQQARMIGASHVSSGNDDVTIDELASYFDLFVHIPRKMSHMAENMYI